MSSNKLDEKEQTNLSDKSNQSSTSNETKSTSPIFRNIADIRTLFILSFTWFVFCINWFFIYEITNKSK